MNTPYFLIRKDILDENINNFRQALKQIWPNSRLSYSVKTNSLPWLLEYLCNKGISAEVVSSEEYHLAKMCGYNGSNCIYNGPIKTYEHIVQATEEGCYINLDSKNDLNFIKQIKPVNAKIGIRVNVPTDLFNENDIGYSEDGFRFGFSDDNGDFANAVDTVLNCCSNVRVGLHLHCNSVTRSIEVYKTIALYAAYLIKKYQLNLSFIDMGGGFFGGVEGKPTPFNYVSAIREVLSEVISPEDTELIVEPGSAIIGSAVDFVTSVIDVKDTKHNRIVTTDGSRINIDPIWTRNKYMFSIQSQNEKNIEKQIICGYTCMDHDRLMTIYNKTELSIGDIISYHRVGAYSMTFGGPFIRYYPEVYLIEGNNIKLIRKRMSVEDYYKTHSVGGKK